jgi:uncharacterized protein (DUF4415 family)
MKRKTRVKETAAKTRKPRRGQPGIIRDIEASWRWEEETDSNSPQFGRPIKRPQKRVTMLLDADILAFFRARGAGYQREINRTLRRIMEQRIR